jgi:thiamine kinase-like enzyme
MNIKPGKKLGAGWTAKVYEWGNDKVIKLFDSWVPLEWVDYELKATRLAYKSGLPVPAVDGKFSINNCNGIVMQRITGNILLISVMLCRKNKLKKYAAMFAGLHTAVNSSNAVGMQSLHFMTENNIRNEKYIPIDIKRSVLGVLEKLPDGESLCHYDFHLKNIIISPKGPFIIDWTGASKGDPAADVARTWFLTTLPPVPTILRKFIYRRLNIFYNEYFKEYGKIIEISTERVDQWKIPILAARLIEERSMARKKFLLKMLDREMKKQKNYIKI